MQLYLTPVDVWLFRDGRPFDAGSDHRARSVFPPYPTVMQGVIRSHHLVIRKVDLNDKEAIRKEVGTATDYGNLRLRGPIIARRLSDKLCRYFPVPANAEPVGGDQVKPVLPQACPDGVVTSAPVELPLLLWPGGEPTKERHGEWFSEENLEQYLNGRPVQTVHSKDLFLRENRIGIRRDETTGATVPEMLYEAEFVRPQGGVGLWLEVEGYSGWPESGTLRIGGEGKGANFETIAPLPWQSVPQPLPQYFSLYFATPAYFEEGWRPSDWNDFFEGDVSLESTAIRGYETIGGFDWAAGRQKPSRRYVPAGSIYYFRCRSQSRLRPDLLNNAVTDSGAEIGFGQIIVSEWR